MASKVYEQHDKHFACVAAYIVMMGSEKVGKIAIKFPQDGAGRLYAYVHWYGDEMLRGSATGYGYDKRSAAIANAVKGSAIAEDGIPSDHDKFIRALKADSGLSWDSQLHREGFEVHQAI